MSTLQRIAKNTGFLFTDRLITKIISFFILLYIARYLGPNDFGKYSFAFAFIYFFSFIPDFGIHNILVREIAKDPKLAGKLIGNATFIQILFSVFAFLLAFLIINLMGYPIDTKNAVYMASAGLLILAFRSFGVVYEVNLRMEYSILFGSVSRIFFLAFVLIAIQKNLSLIYFVLASVLSDLVHALLMVLFSRKFVKPEFRLDFDLIRKLLKESIPVALASVFILIYFRVDVVMLSILKNDVDVGLYSAAYRITEAFLFIPLIFITSIYPIMSKYFKGAPDLFSYTYRKSFKYLFVTGLLFAVITTFLADKIILIIFGSEYYGSIIALKILIWATSIMFVNNLLSFTYISSGNQKLMAKVTAIGAFINISLNLILIPSFSINGAAAATVFTEACIMVFGVYWINRNIVQSNVFSEMALPLIATFSIVVFQIILKSYVNFIILVTLSILIFIGILFFTGWIDSDDKKLFSRLINKT